MAPRRRKQKMHVNGWLIIDKPSGITSTGVCNVVKRLAKGAKTGHGGTLDPLATGVLPIAFGEATKTVPYVMDGRKIYRFTVRWGEARNTDDTEGSVTATSEVRPDRAAIEAVLPDFVGEIEQVPPAFSAIKVDGVRAYDLARDNQAVALDARIVQIDRLELDSMPDADHAVFRVECGKGSYMRSLARDIALALGTVGHVTALRRIAVGPFHEDTAHSLAKLEGVGHIDQNTEDSGGDRAGRHPGAGRFRKRSRRASAWPSRGAVPQK